LLSLSKKSMAGEVKIKGALVHHVYFWLKEAGNEAHKKQLVKALNELTSKSYAFTSQVINNRDALKSAYMFVPGTMALILMLITAMMSSISIVREKELGTMEILLVSPLKPVQIILGKVTPYVLLSVINAITIILVGYFIFHVPIVGSASLLLFVSFIFIFMALCLGILISSLVKTQQTAGLHSRNSSPAPHSDNVHRKNIRTEPHSFDNI